MAGRWSNKRASNVSAISAVSYDEDRTSPVQPKRTLAPLASIPVSPAGSSSTPTAAMKPAGAPVSATAPAASVRPASPAAPATLSRADDSISSVVSLLSLSSMSSAGGGASPPKPAAKIIKAVPTPPASQPASVAAAAIAAVNTPTAAPASISAIKAAVITPAAIEPVPSSTATAVSSQPVITSPQTAPTPQAVQSDATLVHSAGVVTAVVSDEVKADIIRTATTPSPQIPIRRMSSIKSNRRRSSGRSRRASQRSVTSNQAAETGVKPVLHESTQFIVHQAVLSDDTSGMAEKSDSPVVAPVITSVIQPLTAVVRDSKLEVADMTVPAEVPSAAVAEASVIATVSQSGSATGTKLNPAEAIPDQPSMTAAAAPPAPSEPLAAAVASSTSSDRVIQPAAQTSDHPISGLAASTDAERPVLHNSHLPIESNVTPTGSAGVRSEFKGTVTQVAGLLVPIESSIEKTSLHAPHVAPSSSVNTVQMQVSNSTTPVEAASLNATAPAPAKLASVDDGSTPASAPSRARRRSTAETIPVDATVLPSAPAYPSPISTARRASFSGAMPGSQSVPTDQPLITPAVTAAAAEPQTVDPKHENESVVLQSERISAPPATPAEVTVTHTARSPNSNDSSKQDTPVAAPVVLNSAVPAVRVSDTADATVTQPSLTAAVSVPTSATSGAPAVSMDGDDTRIKTPSADIQPVKQGQPTTPPLKPTPAVVEPSPASVTSPLQPVHTDAPVAAVTKPSTVKPASFPMTPSVVPTTTRAAAGTPDVSKVRPDAAMSATKPEQRPSGVSPVSRSVVISVPAVSAAVAAASASSDKGSISKDTVMSPSKGPATAPLPASSATSSSTAHTATLTTVHPVKDVTITSAAAAAGKRKSSTDTTAPAALSHMPAAETISAVNSTAPLPNTDAVKSTPVITPSPQPVVATVSSSVASSPVLQASAATVSSSAPDIGPQLSHQEVSVLMQVLKDIKEQLRRVVPEPAQAPSEENKNTAEDATAAKAVEPPVSVAESKDSKRPRTFFEQMLLSADSKEESTTLWPAAGDFALPLARPTPRPVRDVPQSARSPHVVLNHHAQRPLSGVTHEAAYARSGSQSDRVWAQTFPDMSGHPHDHPRVRPVPPGHGPLMYPIDVEPSEDQWSSGIAFSPPHAQSSEAKEVRGKSSRPASAMGRLPPLSVPTQAPPANHYHRPAPPAYANPEAASKARDEVLLRLSMGYSGFNSGLRRYASPDSARKASTATGSQGHRPMSHRTARRRKEQLLAGGLKKKQKQRIVPQQDDSAECFDAPANGDFMSWDHVDSHQPTPPAHQPRSEADIGAVRSRASRARARLVPSH